MKSGEHLPSISPDKRSIQQIDADMRLANQISQQSLDRDNFDNVSIKKGSIEKADFRDKSKFPTKFGQHAADQDQDQNSSTTNLI